MMGIPPSVPPGGSSSPSGRPSESEKGGIKKPFHMPKKKEQGEKDEKKGSLFDLPKKEDKKDQTPLELEQQFMSEQKLGKEAESAQLQGMSSIEAKEGVAKAAALIQKMISQLQVGTVDGKNFASIDLKGTSDVPSFLANTNLTLMQTAQGLVVRFSNFESPQQQAVAIQAIEANKDQLAQLMMNLQTKNIFIAELQIGTHSVTLPRIEALPSPFKIASSSVETQSEKRSFQEQNEDKEGPEDETT